MDKIVDQLKKSDIGFFCLRCDKTRDVSNTEDMSICLRFVIEGKQVGKYLPLLF